jgi:DNA (cytosine-5)-methyltransferase 1
MLHAIDLFAGAGGLTLGFKAAGVKTVCAVEVVPVRVETFSQHTPGATIENADIQEVDLSRFRGKVEIMYGGPPCQPFSSGGLRKAHDDERNMVPAFIEAIRTVKPDAFLMENVPGLVVGDRRAYLLSIMREMDAMGYQLAHKVVNAAEHGVPQKRRRLFVVGMRRRRFRFPESTHGPTRAHPYMAVRDVLPPHQIGEANPSKVFYAKKPDLRPNPYDGHIYNGGGRPIDRDQPCHTILASAGGNKTHFFDDLNLVPEYHASLMAGNPPRTGTLPGARRLTVLESAIIQTFPPDMVFRGPRSAQYHQVGDAVPPKLAEALARAIVQHLEAPAEERELPNPLPVQMLMWP